MKKARIRVFAKGFHAALVAFLGFGFLGCDDPLIQKVSYKIEPNLETAKVMLHFSEALRSDLGGSFPVKNYGTIEVEPSTGLNPFRMGFRLNLDAINDSEFLSYDATRFFPGGDPFPPPITHHPLSAFQLKDRVNDLADAVVYVDPIQIRGERHWLGVAVLLWYLDEHNFPIGLTLSQGFLENEKGLPQVVGAVFGPSVDENGNLKTPGGMAVFVNVPGLKSLSRRNFGGEGEAQAISALELRGKNAAYYSKHRNELKSVFKAINEIKNKKR